MWVGENLTRLNVASRMPSSLTGFLLFKTMTSNIRISFEQKTSPLVTVLKGFWYKAKVTKPAPFYGVKSKIPSESRGHHPYPIGKFTSLQPPSLVIDFFITPISITPDSVIKLYYSLTILQKTYRELRIFLYSFLQFLSQLMLKYIYLPLKQ